ncbi:unnamed protein product [Psylliodes chrysocephalus]|uniref:E3 ubiquitin-protein ligase CHFR n=1 Tax=Psylliodes chrysocephalus TaxID=3402493 RepID=A0A9P0CGA0_9CUCU|nr:unnamed protein product [Psylliodes chrysocephala]
MWILKRGISPTYTGVRLYGPTPLSSVHKYGNKCSVLSKSSVVKGGSCQANKNKLQIILNRAFQTNCNFKDKDFCKIMEPLHPHLYNSNSSIEINSNPFVIGRGLNCDYILPNKVISREHCKFEKSGNHWFLRDTSTNGTYVNNDLIHATISAPLKDSDSIQLSTDSIFKYTFQTNPVEPREEITDEQLCMIADTVLADIELANLNVPEASSVPVRISNELIPMTTTGSTTNETVVSITTTATGTIPAKRMRLTRSTASNNVIDLTEDSFSMPSTSTHAPVIDLSDSFQIIPTSDLKMVIQKIPAPKKSPKTENLNLNCAPSTSSNTDEKTNPTKNEMDTDSQVDEELLCAICSEMFVKATTLNCSHTFCKFCIEKWKAKQSVCPICRAKITSLNPTLVLDNVIEKVVKSFSKDDKEHRKKIIEERKNEESGNNPPTNTVPSHEPHSPVFIDSDDEDDDDNSSMTDDNEEDYWNDDWEDQLDIDDYDDYLSFGYWH